jgi:hypothetical protein
MKKTVNSNSNLSELKSMFGEDESFTFRDFRAKMEHNLDFCIVFVDGMVDKNAIHDQVIKPVKEASI